MKLYNIYSLSASFCSILCLWYSSVLLCIVIVSSFSLLCGILVCKYTTIYLILLVGTSVVSVFSYYKYAAVNIPVHVFLVNV